MKSKQHLLFIVFSLIAGFIFLLILITPNMVLAGQTSKASNNRYGAIKFTDNAIFLLDKNEGNIWLWSIEEHKGKLHGFLRYHGKLEVGSKMGDLIDTTYVDWEEMVKKLEGKEEGSD